MDLADLWAQHKKFILAVAGALLLLLFGRGFLKNQYDYEEERADADKTAAKMGSALEVPDSVVRDLEADVAALKARNGELVTSMRYKVADEFSLPPNESNPRAYFFRRQREVQKALVDVAERQDIRVPDSLGLKDMAPTDTEEIRRTLLALNVIRDVLVEAIGAGVRRIETIRIEDEAKSRVRATGFMKELRVEFGIVGGERSLRTMIAGLIDGAAQGHTPYLAVDKAHIRPVKGEDGMLQLEITLVALQIEKSDTEETP